MFNIYVNILVHVYGPTTEGNARDSVSVIEEDAGEGHGVYVKVTRTTVMIAGL